QLRAEGTEARWIDVQCLENGPPLAAMRTMLEEIVANVRRERPETRLAVQARLREALTEDLAAVAKHVAPGLDQVLGAPRSDAHGRPGSEVGAEILVRIARAAGPLVLAIDDFHWMDPASREILVRVAHRVGEAPVVVVAAGRIAPSDAAAVRLRGIGPERLRR